MDTITSDLQRLMSRYTDIPTTEEESAGQTYPSLYQTAADAAEAFNQGFIYNPLRTLYGMGKESLQNALDPMGSFKRGYDALFSPTGETAGGDKVLPGGRVRKLPSFQGPPAPPTPGGYMENQTPQEAPPSVTGQGFYRAMPEVEDSSTSPFQIAIPKEYMPEFLGRVNFYKKYGNTTDQAYAAAGAEIESKIAQRKLEGLGGGQELPYTTEQVGAQPGQGLSPQEVAEVRGLPIGGSAQANLDSTTGAAIKGNEVAGPQTWEPRKPTDWAAEYERVAQDIPKWSDMPQMTGLPEYKEPDYGGTLGSILRNLVYGAGMGAIGKDPVKADQERAALAKAEIDKRRVEMRSDIEKQRDFFLNRASAVTNAKLKGIEMRKGAEDKAVSDELAFYQTAIDADPTAINRLAPRIAQLRGIDPKNIQSLYDKTSGKWKIARTPAEIETEKMQIGMDFRKNLLEKYPELGITDPRDKAKFIVKGDLEEGSVEKILMRKAVNALQAGNQPAYLEAMKDIQQYKVANDETLIRENYRFQEAMRELPKLKGKISEAAYESLFVNIFSMKGAGHMLPSMPRGTTGGTSLGKMDPTYRLAIDSINDPDAWNAFVTAHGMAPDAFVQMFDEKTLKTKMPATAWEFGLNSLGYDPKSRAALLEELRYEDMDVRARKIKGTPVRDSLVRDSIPAIRAIYGKIIRKIEENEKTTLTDAEIAKLYEKIQIDGPPRFTAPKKTK